MTKDELIACQMDELRTLVFDLKRQLELPTVDADRQMLLDEKFRQIEIRQRSHEQLLEALKEEITELQQRVFGDEGRAARGTADQGLGLPR